MLRQAWRWSAFRDTRAGTARSAAASFLAADGPRRSSAGPTRGFEDIPHSLRGRSQLLQQPQSVSASYLSPSVFLSMASGSSNPPSPHPKHTNRLANERSPYLLQHAHNPVDWYPWGHEAFEKAKKEDKPIFLSVGYSTCHWCHVMERESFKDEEIGKILSDNFVCIKLDREERPDVDKVYMTFVQATSGGGGWPMSVWLTPDLRPFIGGTYFPPRDQGRRPGFKTVLMRIIEQWQNNRATLESSGEKIIDALKKGTTITANPGESPPLAPDVANRCFQQLVHSYEEEYGGFKDAPKFPSPVNLMFLMSYWSMNCSTSEGVEALQMALHTLRMMALGGIHDHIAQVSGEQFYADVAKDILLYVSRDLSDKSGGFYSAEDADSVPAPGGLEKREGAFCVWTASEVRELLPDVVEGAVGAATLADVFMHHYGVKEQGNVAAEQDPHGELQGKNVLIVRYSAELTAAHFGITVEKFNELMTSARGRMAEVRQIRPRPHLDTKMLASWNGLMLSAFARVGAVLGNEVLLERAVQAGNFLKEHLWDPHQQNMLRSCYGGDQMEVQQISPPICGFLDDYAFVVCGLLDLYEATFQTEWLRWAEELQARQDALFWDNQGGGYFCSEPSDAAVLLRLKEDQDGAEPSANSVSASNLLRLSHYTGKQEWLQKSQQLLAAFSDRLTSIPIALPEMVRALMAQHYTLKQIVICGQKEASDTAGLLAAVNSLFSPFKVVMHTDGNPESFLCQRLPALSSMTQLDGAATAYVCQDLTCSLPVTEPQELRRLLLDGATAQEAL
uniref:Spermatosis associated 20 n=1 Tax=Poecilia reticulata TaxID=8081 RepID=A0A3P9MUP8_POERE